MSSLLQEQIASPSLEEVSATFEQWRMTRTNKRSRIPDALWQQIIPLLSKYPISKISKTLKVSGGQLKAMKCSTNIINANPKPQVPTFVPINIPQTIEKIEGDVGKVEIKRSDGAVLSIDRLNQTTLTHLLTQFMRGL